MTRRAARYPPAALVRILAFALLAALPLASLARAQAIVVEATPIAPGLAVAVSWRIPAGYEESELLIEVDGGPRVRLTQEQHGESPRVLVRLPSLVGTARFLVRAGRKDAHGKHREEDVARSGRFSLAIDPTRPPAALPVRAPSSRPEAGEPMEWWAETPGHSVEGAPPALEGPVVAADAAATPAAMARPSAPPGPAATPSEVAAGLPERTPAAPNSTPDGVRGRAFPGAATPLRN